MSSSPTTAIPQPLRPRRRALALESPFYCAPLHAIVPARCCLARQDAAIRTRTTQASRGQGSLFPSCDHCPQGLALRKALDPGRRVRWRGERTCARSDVRRKVALGQ